MNSNIALFCSKAKTILKQLDIYHKFLLCFSKNISEN